MRILLPIALAALTASPATAQTQTKMNQKAGADYRVADARMTAAWKMTYAAMKKMDARNTSRGGGFGYAAATLASQRAWLQFRDKQCVIEGGEFAGSTMQSMAQANCLTRLTDERTRQLKDLQWKH